MTIDEHAARDKAVASGRPAGPTRGPGRPRVLVDPVARSISLPRQLLDRVEAWRASRRISIAEALRRLIVRGLERDAGRHNPSNPAGEASAAYPTRRSKHGQPETPDHPAEPN